MLILHGDVSGNGRRRSELKIQKGREPPPQSRVLKGLSLGAVEGSQLITHPLRSDTMHSVCDGRQWTVMGENCSSSPIVSMVLNSVKAPGLLDWQLEEERQRGDASRIALCGGWAADGHQLARKYQSGRRQRSRLMGTVGGHPQGVLDRQACSLGTLWDQLFVQESQ